MTEKEEFFVVMVGEDYVCEDGMSRNKDHALKFKPEEEWDARKLLRGERFYDESAKLFKFTIEITKEEVN